MVVAAMVAEAAVVRTAVVAEVVSTVAVVVADTTVEAVAERITVRRAAAIAVVEATAETTTAVRPIPTDLRPARAIAAGSAATRGEIDILLQPTQATVIRAEQILLRTVRARTATVTAQDAA